jgi:DNA-binding transcriptional regulator LsrR (DeoR family)
MAAQFGAGMNMKEIGHRWGISRQLVHRFLKEMQNGD